MPQDGKVTRWLGEVRTRMGKSAHTTPSERQPYDVDRPTHRKLSAVLKSAAANALLERDRHLRDVPHEYHSMGLDPRMVYSCAWFENGDEDLATAQLKKIDHVLAKIGLKPGQSLLDVDCGWGALVIRAAAKFGAHCVGITQSKNQFDWANECIKAAGLADRVEIRLQAWPDVKGRFDRITSLGMFEFDNRGNLSEYFSVLQEHLTTDGVLVSHGIMSAGPGSGEFGFDGGEFSGRYVFPDDELPDLGHALAAMREGGLEVSDIQNLRRHCVRTLHLWEENFRAKAMALRQLVDDRSFQTWCDYLSGWATAFEHDDVAIYEIVGHKVGTRASALPWPGAAG
ncbi:SAM-dependent methyltransferase [Paraburkholderia gardini]|uniref:SAM-dependent methyltransferase n=1 Tax=Paraburkholderia gardini TaxID=2823469 RepID=UPI001DD7D9CA|nr:cyclopropane-fatty-acyl-phospholipid synthase family protein [Paraburkholderia gardini]CAG4894294.1 putative fatty acid methyltransferase [Paraburkholderia gardini]